MELEDVVQQITAYIVDPKRAESARRELRAHLAEAVQEGLDGRQAREEAEAEAVRRLGDTRALAWELAIANHEHLPWRVYLVPVWVLAVMTESLQGHFSANVFVILALLGLFFIPALRNLRDLGPTLRVDWRAKVLWTRVHVTRPAVTAGVFAALAAMAAYVLSAPIIGERAALALQDSIFVTPYEFVQATKVSFNTATFVQFVVTLPIHITLALVRTSGELFSPSVTALAVIGLGQAVASPTQRKVAFGVAILAYPVVHAVTWLTLVAPWWSFGPFLPMLPGPIAWPFFATVFMVLAALLSQLITRRPLAPKAAQP